MGRWRPDVPAGIGVAAIGVARSPVPAARAPTPGRRSARTYLASAQVFLGDRTERPARIRDDRTVGVQHDLHRVPRE